MSNLVTRVHAPPLGMTQIMVPGAAAIKTPRMAERRKWQRLALAVPVFLRGVDQGGKDFLEFTTALNISAGGLLLASRRRLRESARVSIEIPAAPLPPLGKLPRLVRSFQARVVRAIHQDGCDLFGLQFNLPIVPQ